MSGGGDPRFADGKDADALRTIGEVSRALGIKTHVLRYWEQQFPMLEPLKRSGGRRYYRPADINLIDTIDRLVNREGFTLKGARQALQSGGTAARPVAALAGKNEISTDVLPHLRAIRNRLAAALD